MLGKLIKNDFKASAHSMLGIYLVAFITFVVSGIAFMGDNTQPTPLQLILTMLLLIISFAILIVPVFQLISYFNKSLYSNQGYLSYTLPVKGSSLLLSKGIVSFSWILLSFVQFTAVYVLIYKGLMNRISPEVREALNQIYAVINGPEKEALIKSLFVLLGVALFEIVFLIAQIFFTITLSNVKPFNSFGNAGGVILFIIVFLCSNSIFMKLTTKVPLTLCVSFDKVFIIKYSMMDVAVENVFFTIGLGGVIFQIAAAVLMFIATEYLMSKKINIK